jgi:hypothetical protein
LLIVDGADLRTSSPHGELAFLESILDGDQRRASVSKRVRPSRRRRSKHTAAVSAGHACVDAGVHSRTLPTALSPEQITASRECPAGGQRRCWPAVRNGTSYPRTSNKSGVATEGCSATRGTPSRRIPAAQGRTPALPIPNGGCCGSCVGGSAGGGGRESAGRPDPSPDSGAAERHNDSGANTGPDARGDGGQAE